MSVERAVRSMSGLPADILDLDDRGYLREGYVADVAVLDLPRVRDTATFFEPHQYPEGIPFVFINGQVAVDDGAITGAFAGRVLTRENDRVRRDTDD